MTKIEELKKEYIEYFEDVPVQRYAAEFIGRDEDTIIRWKAKDKQFAESIQRAKAVWIRKRVIAVKAEFALEKLEVEVFNKASLQNEPPKYNPAYDIRTEHGQEILRRHTEFMLEVTRSETPSHILAGLRNAKDFR